MKFMILVKANPDIEDRVAAMSAAHLRNRWPR